MGTRDKKVEAFMDVIRNMKSDCMILGFQIKMIHADQAFDSCHVELSEQGITLHCCDINLDVPFVERGIRFLVGRIRCV